MIPNRIRNAFRMPEGGGLGFGAAGIILFLEGYASLSVEVIALRRMVPYAGSNVPVTAILLAAYLAALAIGYERGGRLAGSVTDIRRKLAQRLAIGAALSAFWLSGAGPHLVFSTGLPNLVEVTLYSVGGIAPIGWLLAESILLVHRATGGREASRHAGNIFGLSTAGNVAGALLTALAVLSTIGTAGAVLIVTGTLVCASLIASRQSLPAGALACACLIPGINLWQEATSYVAQTAYADYQVLDVPEEDMRLLIVNRQFASRAGPDGEGWEVIELVEDGLCASGGGRVLVLGAAGQTLGQGRDCGLEILFVDIDPVQEGMGRLLDEREPVGEFRTGDARHFLLEDTRQWDAIVSDVASHRYSVPGHLVTREFYRLARSRIRDGGTLYVNFVITPGDTRFRTRLDRTLRSVFADCQARNPRQTEGSWEPAGTTLGNVLYRCRKGSLDGDPTIYSDSVPKATVDRKLG